MKEHFTEEYIEYLKSEAWLKIRTEKLEESNHQCAKLDKKLCNGILQVHHLHYNTLFREELSDLLVLCEYHHKELHKTKNREQFRSAKYNKGMNTFATKRYGEDWQLYEDLCQVEEEFDEWINDK